MVTAMQLILVGFLYRWSGEDFIDQAVFLGSLCGQEEVTVGVFGDLFDRLASVVGEDAVEQLAVTEDFERLDFNVRNLARYTASRLVNHDAAMGQAITLAFGPASQQDGRSTCSLADAISCDWACQDLHRVVNRQRCDDFATGAVDVEMDVLAAIFALKVEQLHYDFIGIAGMNVALQENDAVFQQ